MKLQKSLWRIFGPVITAGLLLILLLVLPLNFGKVSNATLRKAASSMSINILKGEKIKNEAFDKNYVPFIGSSELSRLDSFHPTVLAQKYHRNYQPFLLGAAGTQSLTHYFSIAATGNRLEHKKAVVIISPQWFVKDGVKPEMFAFYYSPLQTANFLLNAKNTKMDRYTATRLLDMPTIDSDDSLSDALKDVALGRPLSKQQRFYIKNWKGNILRHEDAMFSRMFIQNKQGRINKSKNNLPAIYDVPKLEDVADKIGADQTTNNEFGIKNSFYNKRVKKLKDSLKDSQKDFNYEFSPEYSDFELLLNQFSKTKTDVLFIIPPVNDKWANYTGLSKPMLDRFDKKINYQLKSQGFNNIADLSDDGDLPYFMEDTIHLGWRGWLQVDQSVKPFLDSKNTEKPNYKINNQFYSKTWQNQSADNLPDMR